MEVLAIFLGTIVGIIVVIGVTFLIIYAKIKMVARKHGINDISLDKMVSEAERIKEEDSNRVRSISGMTDILLPIIVKDFPEFNPNQLFNMTEKSLRIVFESLSNNSSAKLNDIPLLRDSIKTAIESNEANGIKIKYKDIKFHKFSLKDYKKVDGVATITVCTSVEYYYEKTINDQVKEKSKYKKQTRYCCKFIYIYDESLVGDYEKVLSTNCPNCGAVITNLGHKFCEYCGTAVKEINLKAWAFSSYEEY